MKERKGVKRGGRERIKQVVGREGKKGEVKKERERGRGCKSCIWILFQRK